MTKGVGNTEANRDSGCKPTEGLAAAVFAGRHARVRQVQTSWPHRTVVTSVLHSSDSPGISSAAFSPTWTASLQGCAKWAASFSPAAPEFSFHTEARRTFSGGTSATPHALKGETGRHWQDPCVSCSYLPFQSQPRLLAGTCQALSCPGVLARGFLVPAWLFITLQLSAQPTLLRKSSPTPLWKSGASFLVISWSLFLSIVAQTVITYYYYLYLLVCSLVKKVRRTLSVLFSVVSSMPNTLLP